MVEIRLDTGRDRPGRTAEGIALADDDAVFAELGGAGIFRIGITDGQIEREAVQRPGGHLQIENATPRAPQIVGELDAAARPDHAFLNALPLAAVDAGSDLQTAIGQLIIRHKLDARHLHRSVPGWTAGIANFTVAASPAAPHD